MSIDLAVYEPPMLAEVGDFDELTHGFSCTCRDSLSNERKNLADETEWLWGPVAF
jgi:hypothetical protein